MKLLGKISEYSRNIKRNLCVHIDYRKKLSEDHKLCVKKEQFLTKLKELEIQFHLRDYSGKIHGTRLKAAIFSVGAG
jgi:hypothetical protein